jgi:hypothetical protein
MSWVKRFLPSVGDDDALSVPTRSVRQVVIFRQYGWFKNDILVVHLETEGSNDLYLFINDAWSKFDTDSRAHADTLMATVLGGADQLKEIGLLTPESSVSDYNLVLSEGFGPECYSSGEADVLFLALELAEKVGSGWIPINDSDIDEIYELFNEIPLWVGFFSPYKQVLKSLTASFMENWERMPLELGSSFAGALGRGYSVVEARLAGGKNPPNDTFGSEITAIRSLPGLDGFRYPKMPTLQYLSRKGLRLLKFLETIPDTLFATRFRANFLVGPQLNSSLETRSINGNLELEDKSLKYQQILTHILFGHLGLVKKDREARKVILGPRNKRHSLKLGEDFIESLDDASRQVYANWINDGDYSKNAPIARHALALSRVIPAAEFTWTRETAVLIANSDSEELQREALIAYLRDGQWTNVFNLQSFRKALEWIDKEYLEFFFQRELNHNYWEYQKTNFLKDWASQRADQPLSNRDVLIAQEILKLQSYFLERARASLLFQLTKQGSLPSSTVAMQWPAFFSAWNNQQLLRFFGVESSDDYPIGVLDVINLEDKDSFELFKAILAKHLLYSQSNYQQRMLDTMAKFAECKKPGALQLLKSLLHDPQFRVSQLEILELLQSTEPTGQTVLDFVEHELGEPSTESLLQALSLIGRDSFAPFWRRNSKEVEQIIAKNTSFPRFFWTNLEAIPLLVRENILGFEGFGLKVIEAIQPSSIGKMNSVQEDLLLKLSKKHNDIFSQDGTLRAMLVASSLPINKLATDHVKKSDLFPKYWLIMLESNLPYPQAAAFTYLESQVGDSRFPDTLLMALDSNNQQARTLAIRVLRSVKTPEKLQQILRALVENRNSDTWSIVSNNLEQLDDPGKLQEFTRQVFLSRRKSRSVKEKIKSNVDALMENIESAVEQDVLIRMAFSSVAKDREWALKRIAQHQSEITGVSVEKSWKSGLNV